MKSVLKFATLATLVILAVQNVFAASVYIPPSKAKPDISRLKADPGCKYIVEYNEFVREYSVNQICNSWQSLTQPQTTTHTVSAPVKNESKTTFVQPVIVQQQISTAAPASVYQNYNYSVSNNFNTPIWSFALPNFSNWISNFTSDWGYEFEGPNSFDIDYNAPSNFNIDYNNPSALDVDYTSPSSFYIDYNYPTSFNVDYN